MPSFYTRGAITLSILTPLVALTLREGSSVIFYLFVVFALSAVILESIRRGRLLIDMRTLPTTATIALLAPLLSIIATDLCSSNVGSSEYEKGLRFALALLPLWLLRHVPMKCLRHVQWGLIGGAIAGALLIIVGMGGDSARRGIFTGLGADYNAVTLANLVLLFGVGSLLTLPWTLSDWPRVERSLKIMTCVLSIVATVISETRSSWMLLPVFALIFLLGRERLKTEKLKASTRVLYLFGSGILLVVVGLLLYKVNQRFQTVLLEVHQFADGSFKDTSIGIRLQLWQTALYALKEHPLLGDGFSSFGYALHELSSQGVISNFVVTNFGEPHNDFMAALAGYGALGLLALLTLYWLPALWFINRLRSTSSTVRVAASIGLLLCLGYTVFSLTEMMFRNMRSIPIYSSLLVIMISLARDDTEMNTQSENSGGISTQQGGQ